MSKLLYSQSTSSIKPYPRLDSQPIAGLDPDYLVLDKVDVAPISYDPAAQSLSSTYVVDTNITTFPNNRIPKGSTVTVDIDQVGSTVAGQNLILVINGVRY